MAPPREFPSSLQPPAIALSERDYHRVREFVYELAGISLNEGKRELVVARLSKRIRQLGLKSVGEYLTYVREQEPQAELITMLDALSTNLTSFWREAPHFEYLERVTLPQLVARAQSAATAACASGARAARRARNPTASLCCCGTP